MLLKTLATEGTVPFSFLVDLSMFCHVMLLDEALAAGFASVRIYIEVSVQMIF